MKLEPLVENIDEFVVTPMNLFNTELIRPEIRFNVLERDAPDRKMNCKSFP